MAQKRPTFAEFKAHVQAKHGVVFERRPLFPGNDNADGPTVSRLVNPANGKTVLTDEFHDGEEATPSMVDHICRRLGLQTETLDLDCGDGSRVSLKSPTPPLKN